MHRLWIGIEAYTVTVPDELERASGVQKTGAVADDEDTGFRRRSCELSEKLDFRTSDEEDGAAGDIFDPLNSPYGE